MKECGILLTLEPFFRSLLKLLYQQKFRNLLNRTRIKIPDDKGRLMIGTVDETDSLKYGEVFVQYSENIDRPQKEKIVKEGLVVVTKNPCLHPGDVRKFVAVNKPELSHLVDCIVFPAKGNRPHPNEISGSDLDGDMYFVCWHEALFPPGDNIAPMDYSAREKVRTKNPITEKDIFKYISKYILSAQLGVIANAHLVHADAQEDGIFSKPCIELARIHSDAVDAPKSGHCPTIPFELRPQSYPHYMNKNEKTIYTSKNIVAKLYDQCRAIDQALFYHSTSKIDLDSDFEVPGFEKYLDRAREILEEYRQEMHTLLDRFELESEIEAWTGQIVTTKRRSDTFEISEKITGPLRELKRRIKRMFNDEFERMTGSHKSHDLSKKQKVSAIYRVTYDYASNTQDKYVLLGLPWLFDDILVDIKSENTKREPENRRIEEKTSLLHKLSIEMRNFYSQTRILEHHLQVYKKLCRIVINNYIAAKLILFGSAVTSINNVNSSVDILIESEDPRCTNSDTFQSVVTVVLNLPENNMNEVQYIPRGKQKFVLNMDGIKVCLFRDRKCLHRTALICATLCMNKWMIPCIKVLAEWASLDKNNKMFGSGSSCLLSIEDLLLMFISFSLKVSATRNSPDKFSKSGCSTAIELLTKNHFQKCQIDSCSHFVTNSTNCDDKSISTCHVRSVEKEAGMILLYFQHYSSNRDIKGGQILDITDPAMPEKQVNLLFMNMKEEQYLQLSDRMTQAYHEFSHATSIADFLQVKQIADDHIHVNLPSQVSAYIAFSSVYQEQKLKQESHADSLTIRLKKFRNGTSTLMLDAWGNSNALQIINQSIQDLNKAAVMMTKGGDIKPRIMGEEAYHIAFEGCHSEQQIIKIERYTGPRQQNHDKCLTYIPKLQLLPGPITNYDFEKLFEAFRKQIHLVRQTYDAHCFGDLKIVISYGTYYLTNSSDQQLTEKEFVNFINLQRKSNNERLVFGQNWRVSERGPYNNSGNRGYRRTPVVSANQRIQFRPGSSDMNTNQRGQTNCISSGYRRGFERQSYKGNQYSQFRGYVRGMPLSRPHQSCRELASANIPVSYVDRGGISSSYDSANSIPFTYDYATYVPFNASQSSTFAQDFQTNNYDSDNSDRSPPFMNASTRSSRSDFSYTQTQSHPFKPAVRTAFIPGRTTNLVKLNAFLESHNFKCTKRLEEYRVSIKLNILGESNESRQSSINGVLILNENFSFQKLQLPYTKWLAFDTIRGSKVISKDKEYDVRFKISSRTDTANEEVLREYDCKDLLINANSILHRERESVIGIHKEYQKRTDFLRHKHLEVYECQDSSRDLDSADVFLRSVKIKVNRGHEFSRPWHGRFNSIDRDRVEVTCVLPLPDLHELVVSDSECRSFVEWIWQFGLELGTVLI